ncbi:hypothetical protein RvY_13040 [Ramazzottius varieornatus]|uniref:Uncharacterized protein n=1 Tax=Ramazzottius varieornatus TaxID=947166 RepID=A0A1D1VRW9_RAMVA|nr:hypothetical protein RvY_13040 [Ramazzottius varieornatus]
MVSISKPTAQLPSKTVEPASEKLPVSDSDVSEERSVIFPFHAEPATPQDASISEYGPGSPEILPPPPKRLRTSTPVTTADKARSVSPEIPLPAPRPPKKPVDNALVAHPTLKRFKIPQPMLKNLFPESGAFGRSVPLNASDLDPVRVEQNSLQQKVSQPARSPASQTSQASPVASPNRVVQNSTLVRFPPRIAHTPVATTVQSVSAPSPTSVLPPASHLPPLDPNTLTASYSAFLNALKQIPIAPHQLVFNLPHPTDASRTATKPVLPASSLYPTPSPISTIQWRPPNPLQPAPSPSGPSLSTAQGTVRTLRRPVELPVGPRQDLREPVLTSLLKAQQATAPSEAQQNTLLQTPPVQQVRLQYPHLQLRPLPPSVQAQPVRIVLPPLYGSTGVVSPPRLIAPNLTNQLGFHPLQHTVPGLPSNLKVVTPPPSMVKPSDGTTQTRPLAQSAQQRYLSQSLSGQSFLYNPSRQTITPTSRVVSSIPQAQQNIVRVPIASTPPSSGQAPLTLRTLVNAPSPQTGSAAVRKHCLGRKTITQPPERTRRRQHSKRLPPQSLR